MPQRIQAPTGEIIEFPDGMSDADISAAMSQEFGGPQAPQQPQQPAPAPVPAPTSTFGGVAKSAGAGLMRGAAGLVGLPGDLSNLVAQGSNWLGRKAGMDIEPLGPEDMHMGGADMTRALEENVTGPLYEPQGRAEKYARTIGEFVPGMAMGPAGGARALAGRAMKQTVAPAMASESAGQLAEAYAPALEPYARVAGAVAGGLSGGAGFKPKMASVDDLRTAKNTAYGVMEKMGATYAPGAYDFMLAGMQSAMRAKHLNPARHPKAASMLQDLEAMKGRPISLVELDQLRQVIRRDVVISGDDAEEFFGDMMMDHIDRFTDRTVPTSTASGTPAQAGAALRDARRANTVLRQAELIEDAVKRAVRRAASTGSGGNLDNAIRQNIRSLLDHPNRIRSFSKEQKELMERIVNPNTRTQDLQRLLGKLSPNSSGLMAALLAAFFSHSPKLATVAGAAGYAAKRGAEGRTMGRVGRLEESIRNKGQVAPRNLSATERAALAATLGGGPRLLSDPLRVYLNAGERDRAVKEPR